MPGHRGEDDKLPSFHHHHDSRCLDADGGQGAPQERRTWEGENDGGAGAPGYLSGNVVTRLFCTTTLNRSQSPPSSDF
jgi:hypothetical protein